MKIMIGADLSPTPLNFSLFENGDVNALLGKELVHLLGSAEYRIFNLERPLTDTESPIVKWGPCLSAPSRTIEAIKKMDVTLFTMANNHIMDQGENGLKDTCRLLSQNGIDYVGAGKNLSEALKAHILEKDGIKVGIYACAEHEFSIAEDAKPGANPFDPLESTDHIAELKEQCDYVIVLYHGGKEHYRYPSPMLQKTCRKLVDKGADIILTQHSHCIGAMEYYNEKVILYGQGNFLFAAKNMDECWNSGLLVELQIDKSGIKTYFHPIVREGLGVRIATDEERKQILTAFEERSKEITEKEKVLGKYNAYADKMFIGYESAMLGNIGKSFLFCALNKLSGYRLIRKIFSGMSMVALRNAMECEAHYELLVSGCRNRIR